jgi:hypothetical protein
MEALGGREEDEVGMLRRDRDGDPSPEPGSRLAPGHSSVVRDDERRPAVDDRDHGRAGSGRGDEER